MDTTQSLVNGVAVLGSMIILALLLKKAGVLKMENSKLFSWVVLHITLPALIFSTLATTQFNSQYLWMAAIMAIIEIALLVVAWLVASVLKFDSGKKGALMLVSAFGMTSLLGYPIIQQIFPGNALAMEEAVVTSEFGVGLLLFVLGPLIAMYFGESNVEEKKMIRSVKTFFISPIFISIIAGIGFSFLPISKTSMVFTTFFHFFHLLGNANTFLVALSIGLILEFRHEKGIIVFLLFALLLKLGLKPVLSFWMTSGAQFTDLMREIVFIETALPSALLVAVFAKQYKCRPDLVSMAIVTTLIASLLSVSLLYTLIF